MFAKPPPAPESYSAHPPALSRIKPFAFPLAASIKAALRDTLVVCLLGPRQSGKTTLARTLKPRYVYVTLDDEATLAFARSDRGLN